MVFPEGEAYIDVHANTAPYERELERKLRESSKDAEELLDIIGTRWGNRLADSTSEELGRHGKDFTGAIEEGVRKARVIHIGGVRYLIDDQGRLRDLGGRFARTFSREVEEEFARLGRPGGPINRIGQGIADAVGAGFNVSGRSPLIMLLIPLIGAIGGLIGAAIQAVNALLALLYTLPALLASIGIQVGTLMIAFQGLGTAIGLAFAAKNAKELNEAVKGLTPSAQAFVKSLLPLRDLFADIKSIVQENFFRALGLPIANLISTLRTTLTFGFGDVATALGAFFRDFAAFLASPTFVAFARDVFPATVRWIQTFGPPFLKLLSVLVGLADQALPFLEAFGRLIAGNLGHLADVLRSKAISGDFTEWLNSMEQTLESIFELFGQVIQFLAVFLTELDRAGGRELIDSLSDFFERLSFFLASPVGQKALEGLVNILVLTIEITGGLLIVLLAVFAAIQFVLEEIAAFIDFLIHQFGPGVVDFVQGIGDYFHDLYVRIAKTFTDVRYVIMTRIDEAIAFVASIPERAKQVLINIKDALFRAGASLIQGFIDGMKSMFGRLRRTAMDMVHEVASFLPGSPAEQGPLAGQGYAFYRGQRMMQDFVRGIQMEAPQLSRVTTDAVSNINFGRGAIHVAFSGEVPTEQEARRTGASVGEGINAILAPQQARLAVRTL